LKGKGKKKEDRELHDHIGVEEEGGRKKKKSTSSGNA